MPDDVGLSARVGGVIEDGVAEKDEMMMQRATLEASTCADVGAVGAHPQEPGIDEGVEDALAAGGIQRPYAASLFAGQAKAGQLGVSAEDGIDG
jgi:hypothetical protein